MLSVEAGLVPIIEPEVLMDGDHTLHTCCAVTTEILRRVFEALYTQRVMLEGIILKPNMVLPGLACPVQPALDEVADATVNCLLQSVPAAMPGIASLSGGQDGELATARLNAMNVRFPALRGTCAMGAGLFLCACHPATGLGSVEVHFCRPCSDERCGEAYHGLEAFLGFAGAHGDAFELLEFFEEVFDSTPPFILSSIVCSWMAPYRYDWLKALL